MSIAVYIAKLMEMGLDNKTMRLGFVFCFELLACSKTVPSSNPSLLLLSPRMQQACNKPPTAKG